jgi:O-antigen ligase
MFVLILILIFVRPFISSLAFPYANLIYSALLGAALLIWIAQKGIKTGLIQPVKYALLLFILSLVISLTLSHDRISSTKELYKYITAVMLILFGASLTNEGRLKIISAIVIAGLAISLLAIYQYFFGFRHILNYMSDKNISNAFVIDYITRGRVFFPFITPNILAGYLIMIIPLALINGAPPGLRPGASSEAPACRSGRESRSASIRGFQAAVLWRRDRNKAWLILPICVALLLTKSLGAFLSIFLAFCAYFYLHGRLSKKGLFLLLGISVILAAVFMSRSSAQKEHLQPAFSTAMRLNYWKETWGIIKAYPFFGIGLGNFNLAYSRYAHNSYLQFWAETGMLGISALFWLIYVVFNYGFKKSGRGNEKNYLILGLLLANSAFLIHNFMDFSFFLPEVSLIWWIILGCILAPDTK